MAYPVLADVKTYLGAGTDTDDTRIAGIMVWVAALIDAYLGRTMVSTTFTQTAYKVNSEIVQLRNYPVASITSITIDDTAQTVSDYHLDTDTGTIYGDFIDGDVNVIVYVGGYATNPAVVDEVFLMVVEDRYEDYKGINSSDVKDVTLFDFAKVSYDTSTGGGGRSLTYTGVGSSGNVPEPLQNYLGMLDMYKSNVVLMNGAGVT